MPEKTMKEWFLNVPWGKVASLYETVCSRKDDEKKCPHPPTEMKHVPVYRSWQYDVFLPCIYYVPVVSWGDSSKPPVLLVHGYVDTAATFIPLVRILPDTFYYVGFDLPGHGFSDTAPGMPVSYIHFTEVIRVIVESLRWDTFICIAHSMGFIISSYYNVAFPGRIRRLVSLDGTVPIGFHAPTDQLDLIMWFQHCFASYYKSVPKIVDFTYEEALSSLSTARGVTSEQAAILASRCLQPQGNGMFRFTWDPKVKKIATVPLSFDMLYEILASTPPVLAIVASKDNSPDMFKEYTRKMVAKLQKGVNTFHIIKVEGTHDVHFINPESFVEHVIEFMNREFCLSKL